MASIAGACSDATVPGVRRLARGLLYAGTAALVLGLGQLHGSVIGGYDFTASDRFAWALLYVVAQCVAAYAVGLPDLARNFRVAVERAVLAVVAAAVVVSLLQLALASPLLPRFVIAWSATFLAPFYVLCAMLAYEGSRHVGRARVVAVVDHEEASALADEVRRRPERSAVLAACATPAEAARDERLLALVTETGANLLVLNRLAQSCDEIVRQAGLLHEGGIRVRTLSLFYDGWLGKLPTAELERIALLFDIGEVHGASYARLKRLLDIAVAIVGLPALLASVPVVAVGNLLGNRGPLLFRQRRVGKGGREFTILKFRTMRDEGRQGTWTSADDGRVTAFGRWLRRSHLDELPQVVNVLRGDLSLVGPRPEQPHYVNQLAERLPFYGLRHLVRPGLTGWAQVNFRYAASEEDALEKLQFEFYYLRHQSLSLDLRILGRTLRAVALGGGR